MTEWHYLVRRCHNGPGWIAFAKREPFIADGHPFHEPGPIWFEFGADEAEARANIEADIRRTMQ